jgi:hypothetical protein
VTSWVSTILTEQRKADYWETPSFKKMLKLRLCYHTKCMVYHSQEHLDVETSFVCWLNKLLVSVNGRWVAVCLGCIITTIFKKWIVAWECDSFLPPCFYFSFYVFIIAMKKMNDRFRHFLCKLCNITVNTRLNSYDIVFVYFLKVPYVAEFFVSRFGIMA